MKDGAWPLPASRAGRSGVRQRLRPALLLSGTAVIACCAPIARETARAATFSLEDGITVTLQTTLDYTGAVRTAPVDNELVGLNSDDGDRNLKSGIVADRFQALEQMNINAGNYGLRASALAWIDTVYLQDSQNDSPDTRNAFDVGPKGFSSATVANEGRRFEPLALFLYGTNYFDEGNQSLKWQIGRQTITWGESLFSTDGISGLQAPIDAYQGELLPNPQAQALFLPTGAAAFTYNIGDSNSISAYWQYEYEPDILSGTGSYFSTSDFVGPGGQRILGTPVNEGAFSIYRAPDIRPTNGLDQFGVAGHTQIGQYTLGAYFIRAIPKTPTVYINQFSASSYAAVPSGVKVGEYNIVYAQPVNAYALSFSTLLGNANVAGELSVRTRQPLVGSGEYSSTSPASYGHPLYPIGNVMDSELSVIDVTPPLPLMPNGVTVDGEWTMNDVLGVTENKAGLSTGRTRAGGGFEATVSPSYYPLSSLQINFPVGWATTVFGKSQFDASENAGTGTLDVGMVATYDTVWSLGLNYQRYYGSVLQQPNLDRDFAALTLQHTF